VISQTARGQSAEDRSEGPAVDDRAPEFRLPSADGKSTVSVLDFIGERPLVLIFGNFTCVQFRALASSIEALTKRYKGRAGFLMVYTREAHPVDGWQLPDNRQDGIDTAQPRDSESRTKVAQTCRHSMKLDFPVAVDTMDDYVGKLYSGMPIRMYLIDTAGKIAYKGGRGPFGFKLYELEQSLVLLLQAESQGGANSTLVPPPR